MQSKKLIGNVCRMVLECRIPSANCKLVCWVAVIFFTLVNSPVCAQTVLNLDQSNSCNYYGESHNDDLYGFGSTAEAEELVSRIVDIVGLEKNFVIMSANVPNASALIEREQRYILYSQNFISRIRTSSGTDWAGLSVLAHEIGHHLNGHTISDEGSRPPIELEADKFSGFVCAKLGASLKEAQAAMNVLASESGSPTHPPKSARLEAIAVGWHKADVGSRPDRNKIEPPVKPTVQKSENVLLKETTTIKLVYSGDYYGCNLPILVSIGGKTFNPQGQSFEISNIPLGRQAYTIEGSINCNMLGGCNVQGQGSVNVEANSIYYIGWKSGTYGRCDVWLSGR